MAEEELNKVMKRIRSSNIMPALPSVNKVTDTWNQKVNKVKEMAEDSVFGKRNP